MPMTDIELLDIDEVYAIPGVFESGNRPLPKPFWNLRSNGAKQMYWLRGDIERWLASLPKPTAPSIAKKTIISAIPILALVFFLRVLR